MADRSTDILREIGARLRALRVALGRTQDDVAERAGLSGKYLSEVERGLRDLPITTLERIVTRGVDSRLEVLFRTELLNGTPSSRPLPRSVERLASALAEIPEPKRKRLVRIATELIALARR